LREDLRSYLVVFEGPEPVARHLITPEPLTVGRDPARSIVILDGKVSRLHLRAYRDAPVNRANGSAACAAGQAGCAPRMLRTVKDISHYVRFAHALGVASLENPLVARQSSGIADSSGGDVMVTLGFWDQETGTPFMQGSTLLHELGHNLGLRHGGVVPSGAIEPNCKPNYQSVMNYLFQVRGLLDSSGVPHIDLSKQQLPTLTETALNESTGLGAVTPYLPRWFAPSSGSFLDTALGTSAATRRCDGSPLGPADPPFVRIDADPRLLPAVDWNGNGTISGIVADDVNFDGIPGETFLGANDISTMDLRQVGARRAVGSEELSYSVIDPSTGVAPVPPAPAVDARATAPPSRAASRTSSRSPTDPCREFRRLAIRRRTSPRSASLTGRGKIDSWSPCL
jgi:hypothetical protein